MGTGTSIWNLEAYSGWSPGVYDKADVEGMQQMYSFSVEYQLGGNVLGKPVGAVLLS